MRVPAWRVGAVGLFRLTHPFPSALDAAATGVLVVLAGGETITALRLAAAMYCLQGSIGALNDWKDVSADEHGKPGKPLVSGAVRRDVAVGVTAVAAALGLALAAISGAVLLALAIGGLVAGYAYDLRLSGTAWSWLPWAIGIPILPIFAWLGGSAALPSSFLLLVPLGAVAGAALAIGNALADVERDAAAGIGTVAVALGRRNAWWAGVLLHVVLVAAALGSAVAISFGARPAGGNASVGVGAVLLGAVVIGAGLALGRRGDPEAREAGWEIQALGIGAIAIGWLLAVGSA